MDDDEEMFFTPDEAIAQFMNEQNQSYSRPFKRGDLVVLGLDFLYGVSHALTSTLVNARDIAAGHVNHQIDRDVFHEEAAREIESMISGDEDE